MNYNSSTGNGGSLSGTGSGSANSSGSNPPPSPPSLASTAGGQQQQQQQHPGGTPSHFSDALLQRPSYSINGILGIPQPDANANSINNKRKREDLDGGEAGELNGTHHAGGEEDIKRQRSSYNGDIYANMWPTTPTQGKNETANTVNKRRSHSN